MPRYYNAKRGPLPLELSHGGSTVVPGKSYIEIAREDEGSASVVRAVKKGMLKPPKIRPVLEPKSVAAPVVVAAAPEPALESEPTPEAESPKEEEISAEEESSPKPKSKRKRTRR